MLDPQYRDAAPSLFSMPGENFFEIGTADDFVRWSFNMYKAGADAVYCSASYTTIPQPCGIPSAARRRPAHIADAGSRD
jgi:ketopantoate hydroxymethyltransferase